MRCYGPEAVASSEAAEIVVSALARRLQPLWISDSTVNSPHSSETIRNRKPLRPHASCGCSPSGGATVYAYFGQHAGSMKANSRKASSG
jgi:hypothetical protein